MPEEKTKYFVVKQKAVPEVLLKVVEAKKLLESERVLTVQEATDRVGISRSSFYKYKEDIFPFYDNTKYSDDPPEYSGQRRGDPDLVRRSKGQHRQYFQDGGRNRRAGWYPLCKDCFQGVAPEFADIGEFIRINESITERKVRKEQWYR